ncbi:MAG TPA: DUF2058 family protein [Luteimonas sp.]
MSDTLRDQLLGLGFKPAPTPDKPRDPRRKDGRGGQGRAPDARGARAPRQDGEGRRRDAQPPRGPRGPANEKGPAGRGRGQRPSGDIDLAKAYAIRAQREKDERIQAERQKQEAARLRREAQAKLAALLEGKGLNAADADHVRHFEYGGKIKRVHVTADQLRALNVGELGVVQLNGRYLLVTAAALAEAEAIYPAAVALKVDPNAPAADDPYSDPKYQVPDDLVW